MASHYEFCGNCGAAFTSAADKYCRNCAQSRHNTAAAAGSDATWWHWRFLLVIPAAVVGFFVPGMVVRISTELGALIPGGDVLFLPMAKVGQGLVDGACAVLFARAVAPHRKMGVSLTVGIAIGIMVTGFTLFVLFFTNYYAGVGFSTVLWEVGLYYPTVIGAGVAVLYAYRKAKRTRPSRHPRGGY